MGARDAIAKLLVGAKRTDLPTRAYHGTNKTFEAFENQPVGYMLDRGLGTHVAADPALASSFADRWIKDKGPDYFSRWTKEVKGEPQILPLRIPAEDKFLPAVQHPYSYRTPEHAPWQAIDHDEYAIERMMSEAAYRKDPDMLARYLVEARNMKPGEAAVSARSLVEGGSPVDAIEGKPRNLTEFVRNYGGKPYNDADRALMTDLARTHWQDQGYAGIKYINTSPTEAGAAGVKDPTSYIVFDPKHIRSEFAAFGDDPASMASSNLLRGAAFAPVGAGVMGETYDQYKGSQP